MKQKPVIPTHCFFQGCYNPQLEKELKKCKEKCHQYNQLSPNDKTAQREILSGLIGKMGKEVVITPPFWCDYGCNITLGNYFYSNHNMIITDGAQVTFGDMFLWRQIAVSPRLSTRSIQNSERPG